MTTLYSPGTMVRARDRDWIVLPESTEDVVRVRPADGRPEESTELLVALEPVTEARFSPPDVSAPGDHHATALLRDALVAGQTTGAGPLRGFARLGFTPRAYQLVPLLVALRMDPVRLLLADDVGLGKTAEAALIVRELLDRGEIDRVAVLCPPVVAAQWVHEFKDKVGLEAALVLPHTIRRLERDCPRGVPLFEHYPITVVSTEFIKNKDRYQQFVEQAPGFIVVDEAHGFAMGGNKRNVQTQSHRRNNLLTELAKDSNRHLLLVTATPHSGDPVAFRSLVGLLNKELADIPDVLSGDANEKTRQLLAQHMVQRRRGDIRDHFTKLDGDPPFPKRTEEMLRYKLKGDHLNFLRDLQAVLRQARHDGEGWSYYGVLSLLRAAASSPAAVAEALRFQAVPPPPDPDAVPETEPDTGHDDLFDRADPPGDAPAIPTEAAPETLKQQLLALAERAQELAQGNTDPKFKVLKDTVSQLLSQGYQPIVFCRYLKTASYLELKLTEAFPGVGVKAVTGAEPPEDRMKEAEKLGNFEKRVLVATPCLAEGVNLQHLFSAVIIYDLSWNPNNHEQAFGRVDRFGQTKPEVRVAVVAGDGHPVDDHVLRVLYDKNNILRESLGVSHFVPDLSDMVGNFLDREIKGETQPEMFETELRLTWSDARDRENRVRTLFAQVSQETMKYLEVFASEIVQARAALGGTDLPERLFTAACTALGVQIAKGAVAGTLSVRPQGMPVPVREDLGLLGPGQTVVDSFTVAFDEGKHADHRLHRTHDMVQRLASHLAERALATPPSGAARRAGAIVTSSVETLTTLFQWRIRFEINTGTGHPLLAEEIATLGCRGFADNPEWLTPAEVDTLLKAEPRGNINPDLARKMLARQVLGSPQLTTRAAELATSRGNALQEAHRRVRQAAPRAGSRRSSKPEVSVRGTPELLALTLYFPVN